MIASRVMNYAKHCRQHLTGYKVPKDIEFRDELPKSNVGKILRRVLRDEEIAKTLTTLIKIRDMCSYPCLVFTSI